MTDWRVWTDAASWSFEPQVVLAALLAAALYLRGLRRAGGGRLRAAAFLGGLAAILLALESPVDALAQSLFAAHMLQHTLLLLVAPPLLLAGEPLPLLRSGLPSGLGRRLAGRRPPLPRPAAALVLFAADLWLWHLPALYDLALRSEPVHDVEHTTFLAVGLLFFAHAVDSPPLPSRLGHPARIAYLLGGMLVNWTLSLALVFARAPLYAPYAHLAARPGGGTALADQQLGAGIMWGPGMLPFSVLVLVCVRRWLAADERHAEPTPA